MKYKLVLFTLGFCCIEILYYALILKSGNHKIRNGEGCKIENTNHNAMVDSQVGLRNTIKTIQWNDILHVAAVSCGDRLAETIVMMKSAIMFSYSPLVFHIFTEEGIQKQFLKQLDTWPSKYKVRTQFNFYNISFPTIAREEKEKWKYMFKVCATQRLFIPTLLSNIDSILYVDTDTIFLSPVEETWSLFRRFNASQLAAAAPEGERCTISWYEHFARHPFYGEHGINSGIMLMNLTRLRTSTWLKSLKQIYTKYESYIMWGDQDLLNIYFHYNQDQLYMFNCEFNFRPDHCTCMNNCKGANVNGVYILHGSRRGWYAPTMTVFRHIYTLVKEFVFGANTKAELLRSIETYVKSPNVSQCEATTNIFTKQMERNIKDES